MVESFEKVGNVFRFMQQGHTCRQQFCPSRLGAISPSGDRLSDVLDLDDTRL